MKRVAMKKTGGVLIADNQQASEMLARVTEGRDVMVEVFQSRNVKNHRRFFAFLQATFDMQEHFRDIEDYRYWLIMKAGRYDMIEAPNGYITYRAHSINFASMDETEFKALFSNCIDIVLLELELDKEAVNKVVDFS